jgi:hypothetical protein
MFTFKKNLSGILPLAQDVEDKDGASEQSTMLDHEDYMTRKPPSRARRLWTSNVPWIVTTIVLSLYILLVIPTTKGTSQVDKVVQPECKVQQKSEPQHQTQVPTPWSPTDASKLSTKRQS